jgi:glycoside/pentoside/hexuronide:cation symporter, GPH family
MRKIDKINQTGNFLLYFCFKDLLKLTKMNLNKTIERPPLSILWIYAMGQLGWSLASYMVSSLLTYFYMPPEEAGAKAYFPNYLPQATFLGLTLLGVIASSGRVFDAFIDPFIANISDRSKNRFGKRRFFMGFAALPLSLFSFLIFHPITEGGTSANALWLTLTIFIYFVSFALYVIPYSALISELGHVLEDRLKISTIISVTWAIGFLIGNTTPTLQGLFEKMGDSSVWAFQKTVGIFSLIALIFLLIPVFFLDEKRYAQQGDPHENFLKSISSVFENKNFRYFALSYLLYWLSLTFIQSGIIYYVTILFGMDKSYASLFGAIGFFISFLFYPFMGKMEKKFGKKQMIIYGFITFCFIFIAVILPMPPLIRFSIVSILSAFPLAVFGILPNTIVADIVHKNEMETGKNLSGMFYGVTAFMMKVGVTFANLFFPSLLILGKSVENPFGVQMSVLAAFIFCMAGFFVFRKYE